MVRNYVLTDREKEIIRFYLDRNLKLDGYKELKHYAGQIDISQIEGDIELIKRFIEKTAGDFSTQGRPKRPSKAKT